MPAIVVAGGLAAAGAIGGAAIGASSTNKAAKNAAQAQLQATEQNNALARENRDFLNTKIDPFYQTGTAATRQLNSLLGVNGGYATPESDSAFRSYKGSTGYTFRVDEGNRAINSGYAARGLLESGAAQKALMRFGQNIASDEFGRYVGQLQGQQGVGLSATNALAGVGTNFVNQTSFNNQNGADALSNAALLRGNANAQFASTAGNALGQFAGTVFGGGGFGGSFGRGSPNLPGWRG